jgi:plasmid stabilization system protein ParE
VTRPVTFTDAAVVDVAEAVEWYESQNPAAAERFFNEVKAATDRISSRPLLFPTISGDVRRALLIRFPHALLFRLADQRAVVIACFHTSRDPQRWKERV